MRIDDKILREILQSELEKAQINIKGFETTFKDAMAKMYRIRLGDSIDIIESRTPIETMSYDDLYKLTRVLYEINKTHRVSASIDKLDVEKYFTEIEKVDFEHEIEYSNKVGDVIFTNWLQVNPDQYVCVIPIEQIIELRDSNRIKYNPKTQRAMTVKEKGGVKVKRVTMVAKSLTEINDLMTSNDFISDDITFNVNPDLYEAPKVVNNHLVIGKQSVIDIIDGFHRFHEMVRVKDKNNQWKYMCIINVTVFTEAKAIKFMLQRNKKNPFTDEQTTKSDKADAANFIITRLNESGDFHLKGTLTNYEVVLNKIINGVFSPTKLFTPQDRQESVKLFQEIESNINELVEAKEYYTKEFTQEEWFVYLYILKHCIDNNLNYVKTIDEIDIESVVKLIRFNKEPQKANYKTMEGVVINV